MDTRNDPIEFSHEDQLGRAPTAKVFTKALLANTRRPMIAAVFGPWGSGKTSFANLMSAELRLAGVKCAWFNPWQFTNPEALTCAFFDLLANSLTHGSDGELASARSSFFAYARGITSLALSNSGSLKLRLTKRDLGPSGFDHEFLSRPSLDDQRAQLTRLFGGNSKAIVVFIDDIDRLHAPDIRLLIQLVKSNADFPNLKFVLLFQKETIEAALMTEGQTGADFLEKIIEVPIELPLIRGSRYVRDLLREVAVLFGDLSELNEIENARWQRLLDDGILENFTTLRQKNRLLDRLQLHKWNIEGGLGIDINLVDLLALEVLRAIDYDIYQSIRRYGPMLTELGDDIRAARYPGDDGRTFMVQFESEFGSGDHELGKRILIDLFPCFTSPPHSRDGDLDERAFRLCRSRHFAKYFFEGLFPEEMSRVGRRRLEYAVYNGQGIYELLCAFAHHGLLSDGLEYLRSLAPTIPSHLWNGLASDLGKASDHLGKRRDTPSSISVAREALAVLLKVLERGSVDERLGALLAVANQPDSMQLAVLLFVALQGGGRPMNERLIKRAQLKLARDMEGAAEAGILEDLQEYGSLLDHWEQWTSRRASLFVRSLAGEPTRFTLFARAISQHTREVEGIGQISRSRVHPSGSAVLRFLPKRLALTYAQSAYDKVRDAGDREFLGELIADLKRAPRESEPAESGSASG